ncbi:MAG: hypothetical protein K2X29_05310, partial [Candidatus Obscuribacterales bacterium]|nr:hypothetical protein [Candidatus Obscuribacterales bacterium]
PTFSVFDEDGIKVPFKLKELVVYKDGKTSSSDPNDIDQDKTRAAFKNFFKTARTTIEIDGKKKTGTYAEHYGDAYSDYVKDFYAFVASAETKTWTGSPKTILTPSRQIDKGKQVALTVKALLTSRAAAKKANDTLGVQQIDKAWKETFGKPLPNSSALPTRQELASDGLIASGANKVIDAATAHVDLRPGTNYAADVLAESRSKLLQFALSFISEELADRAQKKVSATFAPAGEEIESSPMPQTEALAAVANLNIVTRFYGTFGKTHDGTQTKDAFAVIATNPNKVVLDNSSPASVNSKIAGVRDIVSAMKVAGAVGDTIGSLFLSDPDTADRLLTEIMNVFSILEQLVQDPLLSGEALRQLTDGGGDFLFAKLIPFSIAQSLNPQDARHLAASLNQKDYNYALRYGYPRDSNIFQRGVANQVKEVLQGTQGIFDIVSLNRDATRERNFQNFIAEMQRQQQVAALAAQAAANNNNNAPGQQPAYNTPSYFDWRMAAIYTWIPNFDQYTKYLPTVTPNSRIAPLLLDLDGDGVETVAVDDGIFFDHDLDGTAELSAWVDLDDGVLAWDKNKNGIIDDATELFGDFTILSNGEPAGSGFAALADIDENNDGKIDALDSNFNQLGVLTGTGALRTLKDLNIESLNLDYTDTDITDPNGNVKLKQGTYRVGEFRDTKGRLVCTGNHTNTAARVLR